jgi:hypothetical protein
MEHITLLLRVSAAGFSLKPLAILPLLTVLIFSHEVNNFYDISGSESDWITDDILKYWYSFCKLMHSEIISKEMNLYWSYWTTIHQ